MLYLQLLDISNYIIYFFVELLSVKEISTIQSMIEIFISFLSVQDNILKKLMKKAKNEKPQLEQVYVLSSHKNLSILLCLMNINSRDFSSFFEVGAILTCIVRKMSHYITRKKRNSIEPDKYSAESQYLKKKQSQKRPFFQGRY